MLLPDIALNSEVGWIDKPELFYVMKSIECYTAGQFKGYQSASYPCNFWGQTLVTNVPIDALAPNGASLGQQ